VATFDTKVFASSLLTGLLTDLPAEAKQVLTDSLDAKTAFDGLQQNVTDTLAAIQTETDGIRLQNLKDDLTGALLSSRRAIESIVFSRLSNDAQNIATTAMDVAVRIAVTAAQAFILAAI
jgi:hypothetical protein